MSSKTRVRSVGRRRRYRPAGIDRYILEAQMEPLWANVRTVEQLRDRFRNFAADNQTWSLIQQIFEEVKQRNKTLDALGKRCREIGAKK